MAYRELKDANGNPAVDANGFPRRVYVPDGWKSGEPASFKKVVHGERVMQELYIGRRYNLMNNNSMPEYQEAQLRNWVGDFLKPPEGKKMRIISRIISAGFR